MWSIYHSASYTCYLYFLCIMCCSSLMLHVCVRTWWCTHPWVRHRLAFLPSTAPSVLSISLGRSTRRGSWLPVHITCSHFIALTLSPSRYTCILFTYYNIIVNLLHVCCSNSNCNPDTNRLIVIWNKQFYHCIKY